MAYPSVTISAAPYTDPRFHDGFITCHPRALKAKRIAYSMTWSVLKNRKFSTYSGDTVTLCLLDRKKISVIHDTEGSHAERRSMPLGFFIKGRCVLFSICAIAYRKRWSQEGQAGSRCRVRYAQPAASPIPILTMHVLPDCLILPAFPSEFPVYQMQSPRLGLGLDVLSACSSVGRSR